MKQYFTLFLVLFTISTASSNNFPIRVPAEPPVLPFSIEGPTPVSWKLLTKTDFKLAYNEKTGTKAYSPIYPEAIKQLNGKMVRITGYVIPYDESQVAVALSATPYAACFFCGKASPASILTLSFAKPGKRYKVDAYHTFEGRMRLNYDDPDEFYFVLDDAREVKNPKRQ